MKKLLIVALIVVAAGTSAFAADVKVSTKVKSSFENLFYGAQNLVWASSANYLKATFILNEEEVEAFFAQDGELIGTSRKVDLKKLPLSALQRIKKEYASYKITESIEFENEGVRTYYVSLEDGNKKQVLEVSLYGAVSAYKTGKK